MANVKLNINIKDKKLEKGGVNSENTTENTSENDGIQLKLGDIIQIIAPDLSDLNKNTFFIDFLSPKKLVLKNIETLEIKTLHIDENGDLEEKGITEIELLSRDEEQGYARQNGLIPGQWINIEFSGNIPFIVVGEIMDLEEDMIEVKSYPDGKTIYIDFAYQGIPEDLPIVSIDKRSSPEKEEGEKEEEEKEEEEKEEEEKEEELMYPEVEANTPQIDLEDVILEADDIVIGEDLGTIEQEIELDKRRMRFGLQNQVDDMLDELLASIPENKRSRSVLNNIHLLIERFKQLRAKYSRFDDNGNAMLPIKKTANYKPLVKALNEMNQNIHWLMPVATNKKFVYDIDEDETEGLDDVVNIELYESLNNLEDALNMYYTNNVPDGENKQKYLSNIVKRFWSPFTDPEEYKRSDILNEKKIQNTILTIINNYDNYDASVAKEESIINKKYLTTQYLTDDIMAVKSLMMLPEYAFRYAKAYLPETSILDRASYNAKDFFVYTLLKKNAALKTINVDISDDKAAVYEEDVFLRTITEIVPEDGEDIEKDYKTFLEQAIPRTRVFFQLIKKYISNNVSFYDIVHNLEPFLVYHDDITYKQYQEMTKFISEKIMDYKKNVQKRSREFKYLHFGKKFARRVRRPIFDILNEIKNNVEERMATPLLFDKYNIPSFEITRSDSDIKLPVFTNSEILKAIYDLDQGRTFFAIVANANKELVSMIDLSEITKRIRTTASTAREEKQQSNKCKATRIVKVYKSLDDLLGDNYKTIYHDKTLDQTYYDIIDNYVNERETMSSSEFKQFLVTELENNIGLSTIDAVRDAEAMIEGRRVVENGEYCVLNEENNERSFYYKRVGDAWQRDENVFASDFEEQRLICNLRPDCVALTKKKRIVKDPLKSKNDNKICSDKDLADALIEERTLDKLIQAFNIDFEVSRDELLSILAYKADYNMWKISQIKYVNDLEKFKTDTKHIAYGTMIERESEPILSPHSDLLDRIMSQDDIVKRSRDINDFVTYLTVVANPEKNEDPHWLYCKETGVKLLPIFISELSNAFNDGPNTYYKKVEELCATIGEISDDGSAWVDKYSGYIIKKIDYDVEEGFEESGYKKVSRDILEEEFSVQEETGEKKYTDPRGKMVNAVITSMSSFMGINIDAVRDFIIQQTLILVEKLLPPETEYTRKMTALEKKGKRTVSYETAVNTSLLMTTLAYYHVAILTMIPSVRTKKQFPGCVKSFTGYPLTGAEDFGGLAYVVCVANKIKSSSAPWSIMKRMNEKSILKRVKDITEKYLLQNEDVQEKIRAKLEYNKLDDDDQIPNDIDVSNWNTFLPPLAFDYSTIKVDALPPVFFEEFEKHIRKGDKVQNKEIGVIEGKAMHYSHEIISHIQNIIQKELPLLKNNAEEPFLENSCCVESGYDAIGFFTKKSKDIEVKNNTVAELESLIKDFYHVSKSQIFAIMYKATRVYPIVSDSFREHTIYQAFIHFCNYDSVLPVPTDVSLVCGDKPATPLAPISDLSERIEVMKAEGKNYTQENLENLLSIVAASKTINIDFDPIIIDAIDKLRIFLTNTEASDIFMKDTLRTATLNLVNSIDTNHPKMYKIKNYSAPLKEVINAFTNVNNSMREDIRNYIRIHSSLTKRKKETAIEFLESIFVWDSLINVEDELEQASSTKQKSLEEGVDRSNFLLEHVAHNDAAYKTIINYCENLIVRLAKIIPTIIINAVDYDDQTIMRHWKLSERHNSDISALIMRNYEALSKFYEAPDLVGVLKKVVEFSTDLVNLARKIPTYNNNVVNGEEVHHVFDKSTKILFLEYIIMKLFSIYMMLADQPVLHLDKTQEEQEVMEERENIGAIVSNLVQDVELGEIEEIDIVTGRVAQVTVKISDLFVEICNIFARDKKTIDYSHQNIIDRVNISREKEKDMVTERLKDLSDEERQVENLLKAHKLGQWNKGLLKGLTQYVPGTYDEERAVMEAQAEMERKLGKDDRVTAMNREIYAESLTDDQLIDAEIEREEMDLTHLGEDDDHGDLDGDEFY